MSFLSLRQQIDNWTLKQDDEVTITPFSSSVQSAPSPTPSSSQKGRSTKRSQTSSITSMRDRCSSASAITTFSDSLSSSLQRMYHCAYPENIREKPGRKRREEGRGKTGQQVQDGCHEGSPKYRDKKYINQRRRGGKRQCLHRVRL